MKIRLLSLMCVLCIVVSACSTDTPKVNKPVTGMCTSSGGTAAMLHTKATLPAAQGNWPTFHGDINHDGAAPISGNGGTLQLAWSFCTRGAIYSSPIVQDGVVYFASTDTTLTAIDIQSGRMLWQIQSSDAFYGTPMFSDGAIYIGSLNGTVYAVNAADGFVRWHTQIDTPGSKIWASPTVANGLVIVEFASTLNANPKRSGQVVAYDATTGKLRWRTYIEQDDKQDDTMWNSPVVDTASSHVFVSTGDPNDGVEALDLKTGHVLWHWRSASQGTSGSVVGAGPLLFRNSKKQLRVVMGGKNGDIYTLDAKTGHLLWQAHVGDSIDSEPAFTHNTLYVVGLTGHIATVYGYDAQTSAVHWHHDLSTISNASPAIVGQTVYLPLGDNAVPGSGGIVALATTTGQQLQLVQLHTSISSSPAVLSSWLFVGAHDGNMYAFTY